MSSMRKTPDSPERREPRFPISQKVMGTLAILLLFILILFSLGTLGGAIGNISAGTVPPGAGFIILNIILPITGVIVGIFGWVKARRYAYGHVAVTFPLTIPLIEDKLTAHIYLHEIDTAKGLLSCWSYVSDGLRAFGQKEIVFTLLRDRGERPEGFPRLPLDFFRVVYKSAQQGKIRNVGAVLGPTTNTSGNFLGFPALAFSPPQILAGVDTPFPVLQVICLTSQELQAVKAFGFTRVMARLGKAFQYYPCPPWTDRNRPSIRPKNTLQQSILANASTIREPGMRVRLEKNGVTLRLLSQVQQPLSSFLEQFPLDASDIAIALLTELDPGANCCLAWEPGQSESLAIKPPGSDGSILAGCFVAFLTGQDNDGGKIFEDGFFITLTVASWAAVRKAIETRQEIFLPATNENNFSFSIKWIEEAYNNPIDGLTYRSEGGWEKIHPEKPPVGKDSQLVKVKEIILLNSDREMKARVKVEALSAYMDLVDPVVLDHFVVLAPVSGLDLLVQFEIQPDGKVELQIATQPGIEIEKLQNLYDRLHTLPPPPVKQGPIKFQISYTIAGGSGITSE